MKRLGLLPTLEPRHAKVQRTVASSNPNTPFTTANYIPFSEVVASVAVQKSEDDFIDCEVYMFWPGTGAWPVKRIQLQEAQVKDGPLIEIQIHDPLTKIRTQPKLRSYIKLSLRGATTVPSTKVPITLVFEHGVLLQMKSRDEKEVVVHDLFPPAQNNDYYSTPQPDPVPTLSRSILPASEISVTQSGVTENRSPSTSGAKVIVPATSRKNIDHPRPSGSSETLTAAKMEALVVQSGQLLTPSVSPPPPTSQKMTGTTVAGPSTNPTTQAIKSNPKRPRSDVGNGKNEQTAGQPPRKKPKHPKKKKQAPSNPSTSAVLDNSAKPAQENHKSKRDRHAKRAEKHQPRNPILDMEAGYARDKHDKCLALADLKRGARPSFAGILVEIGEAKQTATKEWSIYVKLVDPSFRRVPVAMGITLFVDSRRQDCLPIFEVGQPLLLRTIVLKEFEGKLNATGFKDSFKWVAYDPRTQRRTYGAKWDTALMTSKTPLPPNFWSPSDEDIIYLRKLALWWDAAQDELIPQIIEKCKFNIKQGRKSIGGSASTSTSVREPKQRTISEVQPQVYFDCVVQLLRIEIRDRGRTELYVADYTKNPHPKDHSSEGLSGVTLKVTAWELIAENVAMCMQAGAVYRLKNLHPKLDSNGWLEAMMRDPNAYQQLSSKSAEVASLLKRKEEWERDCNDNIPAEVIPLTQEQRMIYSGPNPATVPAELSDAVRNLHPDEDYAQLQTVLSVADFPRHFRIAAKVKEYQPKDLRNWVRGYCKACEKVLPKEQQMCCECGDDLGKDLELFYQFALRIEDNSGAEAVVTAERDDAAQFLSAIPPAYIDTFQQFARFNAYVTRAIGGRDHEEDLVCNQPIDICIRATNTETCGPVYTLFGCEVLPLSQ